MSILSRQEYYSLLYSNYSFEKIPIIYSHGGVNGFKSFNNPVGIGSTSLFNEWDINLFDDEIILIAKTNDIIGLNIDQRVMSSKNAIHKFKNDNHWQDKMIRMKNWSGLIWNNIQNIAEVLDI